MGRCYGIVMGKIEAGVAISLVGRGEGEVPSQAWKLIMSRSWRKGSVRTLNTALSHVLEQREHWRKRCR